MVDLIFDLYKLLFQLYFILFIYLLICINRFSALINLNCIQPSENASEHFVFVRISSYYFCSKALLCLCFFFSYCFIFTFPRGSAPLTPVSFSEKKKRKATFHCFSFIFILPTQKLLLQSTRYSSQTANSLISQIR